MLTQKVDKEEPCLLYLNNQSCVNLLKSAKNICKWSYFIKKYGSRQFHDYI